MNAIVTLPTYGVSDLERIARAFATSKLFGIQTPEQALALCLIAQAEGRHPASAAQDYHIVSGRPAKKAEAMLRDLIAGGGKVEWHELSDEKADATFSHPQGGSARIDWTMKRAAQAGINNPMWKKYPRQMLRARVVSEGVRTVFPMATSGMYVPEEAQDIAAEPRNVTPAPETVADAHVALPAPSGPQEVEGPPMDLPAPVKRLSSAEAKRQGLHTKIQEEVDACADGEALAAWRERFNEKTAPLLPLSWLDPVDDMVLRRAKEIASEEDGPASNPEEDALDAEFRATVGA